MKDTTFCFGALGVACLMLAGWAMFGKGSEVVASTTHNENPMRAETFEVDRGDGRKQSITRFFDVETGFVCYTANWSANTDLMGRCTEVDGTDNRERIRKRYKKD
jgi:hypothetical protein|uniref:Uncharacterized protein n=1 Tax=Myoviridae sp. ctshb19 TaxID=2825194 RepID=A0A8S5UGH4_9CAUD|nr:MAG TPA: hypothetical protein [Myoviridae sp. ctshb19]